jgi:type I restriction enzyme S subunit
MIPNQGENVFKLDKLPSNWKACLLVDAVDIKGGSQPPKKVFKTELEQGYIRLVQIRDYKSDRYLTYVPINSTKKFCTTEDIMIGRYGPPVFQILKGIEGAYNVALMKANPLSNMDRDFLYYLLLSPPVQKLVIGNSQRTAGQTGVNLKLLNNCIIPLPPLDQQKKIVAILDAADTYRQKTKALIKKYDELTQSLFLDMFGDPVANPKGWELKRLSEFIKSLNTGVSVNSTNKEYREGDFGILKTSCVYSGIFRPSEAKVVREDEYERMRLSPKADSIIISRMNTTELVGKSAYIENDYNNLFLPDRLWQIEKAGMSYNVRWLSHALSFQSFRNEIGKISSGTSGSMKNISKKNYLKLPIIYPPNKLQNQFADSVQAIEAQKAQAEASLAKAENLFNSLLQRAFKGGLV